VFQEDGIAGNSLSWLQRRYHYLKGKGIHFIGCGVSGGEEGARYGPSLMPGGDVAAWYGQRCCYLPRRRCVSF
jgi:6-phosphogluconate dehydrogenase